MNDEFSLFCIHNIIYNRVEENHRKNLDFFLHKTQTRSGTKQTSGSKLARSRHQRELDTSDINYRSATEARSQPRELDSMERELGLSNMKSAGTLLEELARVQRAGSLSRRARFVSCARVQKSAESRELSRVAEMMSASSQRASSSRFPRSQTLASNSRPKLPGLRSRLPGSHPRTIRSHRGEIQPDLIVYAVSRQLESGVVVYQSLIFSFDSASLRVD